MSLALKVNKDGPNVILLEIHVDGEVRWEIAIDDERPDMAADPVLLVYDNHDAGEEPAFTRYAGG